jgi:hypothetical protein
VSEDTAFIRLERDLGRLEGVVESLVRGIQMDRESASAQRRELYAYIEASNDRNEKIVKNLSDQIAALVKADRSYDRIHARSDGAWGVSRWTFTAGISLIALLFTWVGYQQGAQNGGSDNSAPSVHMPAPRR